MAVSLEALAKRAKLPSLVEVCERRVVSEQWASSDIWSPEPLWFERHRERPGRKLKAQPAKTKDAKLYGYDASGAVVRVRTWNGYLGKWYEDALFVRTSEREMIGYRFRGDELLSADRFTYDKDGRLVAQEMYSAQLSRSGSQTFVYKKGALVRVDVKKWGQSWELEHDDVGLLKIDEVRKDGRNVIYRR